MQLNQVTDSFTIWSHEGICEILTMSRLPQERLTSLLSFAFSTYAPVVLLSESVAPGSYYAYVVAHQGGGEIDDLKLLQALGQKEQGWSLTDGVIYSPRPSRMPSKTIIKMIAASRPLVESTSSQTQ
jgi:hypothetical protein